MKVIPLVVAESIFVLTGKVYAFKRQAVADTLKQFLQSPSVKVENREALLQACDNFRESKVDFVDAYLAAMAQTASIGVASFDKDFKHFPDVEIWKG